MGNWGNFFLAEAGASAALAGLVFVGISINIAKIVQYPSLPNLALEAIIALLQLLAIALLALVPGQSLALFGGEVLAVSVVTWVVLIYLDVRSYRAVPPEYRGSQLVHVAIAQLSTVPLIIAGILLLTDNSSGLYWIVVGTLFTFFVAVFDAWVLLVEVNR